MRNYTPRKRKTVIERFLALITVDPVTGCWNWIGTRSKGYGQFKIDGRKTSPYRFAWEHFNNKKMPDGLEPDHTCNNRQCCNWEHIEPVTHQENQRRAAERARAAGKIWTRTVPRPAACPHGHEYTPDNARINSQGAIVCRECNKHNCREYKARKALLISTTPETSS